MTSAPRCAFVIFGVTGDLAARKLMPALYALHRSGALHEESVVVGYSRSGGDDEALRRRLRQALEEHADGFDEEAWEGLRSRIHAAHGGYDDVEAMGRLARLLDELGHDSRVFYTATPPSTYAGIASALAAAGLNQAPGFARLVIEKPFGRDLASARELNDRVLQCFAEEQVYRIDHYLAKETAQNLAVLRFANTLFEPVWSNRYIDHVQITMAEPMGVEGRGSFYEAAGVIRDVFQNHLLQLAALVAMEPPARYDARSVRNEKVKVFEAMACLAPEAAVLGQYAAQDGMRGYRQEEGVAPDSRQATYAAAQFAIRNWRWEGVPFFLRSGKRLEMKATEIVLHYKRPPHVPFAVDGELRADRLVLRLSPDEGISVRFNAKTPGQGVDLERVSMDFSYQREFHGPNPDAYETLLLDAMQGDATLFMRADEVEAQWRIVRPLLERWEDGDEQPRLYPAGSMGPPEAFELLERQGRYWHRPAAE